ncbi:hypothetical protein CDH60_11085 [Escherichia coli]|nr:hypothetical protein [Escherichia coli]PAB94424.1 hypothetical protein CDH60_11085 [Escherichia coli]
MAAFRILRLNPALNTLSFVKILIAMCRIPENNSAAFPLLILQSSSFITPVGAVFGTGQCVGER